MKRRLHAHLLRTTLRPSATVFGQDFLAQSDLGRRDFDQLVVLDVFEGELKGELTGRFEQDILVGPGSPHVRELFFLAWVDRHVVGTGVFGNDHSLIDVVARFDEHRAALLQAIQRECDDLTLELALEYIEDDELVEVTPSKIRLRKKVLTEDGRRRSERSSKKVSV